jgi:hypothetical protein
MVNGKEWDEPAQLTFKGTYAEEKAWEAQFPELMSANVLTGKGYVFAYGVYLVRLAVEAGKADELLPVHLRKATVELGTLARINMSPGYIGSAHKTEAEAAADGHLTIAVPGNMVGRWVGQNKANMLAIASAYGMPVTLKSMDDYREVLTIWPSVEVKVKKCFTEDRPSGSGKSGFGFVSSPLGDVYFKNDLAKHTIKNLVDDFVGMELVVDLIRERGKTSVLRFQNEKWEAGAQKRAEDAQRESAREAQRQNILAEIENLLPESKELAPAALPLVVRPSGHGKVMVGSSKTLPNGISISSHDLAQVDILSFDPESGPTIRFTQKVRFEKGWVRGPEEVFSGERSGWDGIELVKFGHQYDGDNNVVIVKFDIFGTEFECTYPVDRIQKQQLGDRAYAVTPLGEVSTLIR